MTSFTAMTGSSPARSSGTAVLEYFSAAFCPSEFFLSDELSSPSDCSSSARHARISSSEISSARSSISKSSAAFVSEEVSDSPCFNLFFLVLIRLFVFPDTDVPSCLCLFLSIWMTRKIARNMITNVTARMMINIFI